MTARRAAAFWFFLGVAVGVIFYAILLHPETETSDIKVIWQVWTGNACKTLDPGGLVTCLQAIAEKLTALTAYGAIMGLIGLAIQLALRGEWPTGHLNEGRPKVLDPAGLVTAAIAAALSGIVAAGLLTGEMRVPAIIAFSYLAADLATLATDLVGKLWEWVKAQFQKLVGAK